MKFLKLKKKKGFTIIETLVAVAIFSSAVLAMMAVLANGISNTSYAKAKNTATFLAQEGIEYMRNMRDDYTLYQSNGWSQFVTEVVSTNSCTTNYCGFNNSLSPTDPAFISLCANLNDCKLYVSNGSYNTYPNYSQIGSYSGFKREIQFTSISSDEMKVISRVEWTQKSTNYSVTLSENLFNWVQ